MKYFKKKLTALAALMMAFTMLASCSGGKDDKKDDDDEEEISSSELVEWYADKDSHWQLDENGEQIESGKHKLSDDVCSVCKASVWEWDDGEVNVTVFDKYGNTKLLLNYDENGELYEKITIVNTYDGNGNLVADAWYDINDALLSETVYVIRDGISCISTGVDYYDDGSKNYCEYDEYGNVFKSTYYENDVAVSSTSYEITYDDNGFKSYEKIYRDGVLESEVYYTVVSELGYTYAQKSKHIFYYSEGGRMESTYNEDGFCVEEIEYDASGNAASKNEYAYDSEFNTVGYKEYKNGVLVFESVYDACSDGVGVYLKYDISYSDDGSKTVVEYDEGCNRVSEIIYDKDGNVIG